MADDKIKVIPIESLPLPDAASSFGFEKKDSSVERPQEVRETAEVAPKAIPVSLPIDIPAAAPMDDVYAKRQKAIEDILSKDLKEMYLALSVEKRMQFKAAGEETARKINELLDDAKSQAMKIVDLIRKWLSMLPGANKYFIEQEAKIRADEIMKAKP